MLLSKYYWYLSKLQKRVRLQHILSYFLTRAPAMAILPFRLSVTHAFIGLKLSNISTVQYTGSIIVNIKSK